MELTFPFRNWAYNNLLGFFEMQPIEDYSNAEKGIESWASENFDVNHYHDRLPSFENELLQVIETTNQDTIDHYFKSFYEDTNYIRSILSLDYLTETINTWNKDELHKFEELVAKKAADYQKNPNRERAHLESYLEEPSPLFYFSGMSGRKYQVINYNYYCIEDKLKYVKPEIAPIYFSFIKQQVELFFSIVRKYGGDWEKGLIKARIGNPIALKPIIFCECDIDIVLIRKAAELLRKDGLLGKVELRHRGGYTNLDKLWSILTDDNWETVPQQKILLYDCDTEKQDQDFGHIFKRIIPRIETHKIQKGIENLFSDGTIDRAIAFKQEFVDTKVSKGTTRGVAFETIETNINKHEKRNFCNWVLENGTKEDFEHFSTIFDMIEKLLS